MILISITAMLLLSSCKNEYIKKASNVDSLEVYADSLFRKSIDSTQIAGGALLVFQKNHTEKPA